MEDKNIERLFINSSGDLVNKNREKVKAIPLSDRLYVVSLYSLGCSDFKDIDARVVDYLNKESNLAFEDFDAYVRSNQVNAIRSETFKTCDIIAFQLYKINNSK